MLACLPSTIIPHGLQLTIESIKGSIIAANSHKNGVITLVPFSEVQVYHTGEFGMCICSFVEAVVPCRQEALNREIPIARLVASVFARRQHHDYHAFLLIQLPLFSRRRPPAQTVWANSWSCCADGDA